VLDQNGDSIDGEPYANTLLFDAPFEVAALDPETRVIAMGEYTPELTTAQWFLQGVLSIDHPSVSGGFTTSSTIALGTSSTYYIRPYGGAPLGSGRDNAEVVIAYDCVQVRSLGFTAYNSSDALTALPASCTASLKFTSNDTTLDPGCTMAASTSTKGCTSPTPIAWTAGDDVSAVVSSSGAGCSGDYKFQVNWLCY